MAKFVKLEDEGYINVDAINYIAVQDDKCKIYTINDPYSGMIVTKTDVENILKASE